MRQLRAWVFLLAAAMLPASALSASAPTEVIDALDAQLLDTMKHADQLGIQGRYDLLQPILEKSFDFERMIAVAAGSYWTSADASQRQPLLEAFTKMSVANYAARFDAWNGESFETLGERSGPRDSMLVDTRLDRKKDAPVDITYVMTQRDGTWRIVDVLLERSISQLAVQRSEYNQVLRDGGVARLTQTLETKAAQLLTK